MKQYQKWLLWEIPVLCAVGSGWHFLFPLFHEPYAFAWLMPVNESVWEHLKLAWLPLFVAWLVCALRFRSIELKRFATGALAAQVTAMVALVAGHYTVSGLVGHDVMAADILLYFVAMALAQLIGTHVMCSERSIPLAWTALLFTAETAIFAIFTYHPPEGLIFIP